MRMVSYAQNAEDVVLARAFTGFHDGYYVDVGAGHPVLDSTTKHFYDLGWHGINVEPLVEEIELFTKHRPRDVNLEIALSDRPGTTLFFAGPPENLGSSTLDEALVASYRQRGEVFEERTVVLATLQSVLEEHAERPIDLLKIDVEGHEELVLRGIDLSAWRPRVVMVEATHPNSQVASHEAWEPLLVSHGYEVTLFDGLNRFYVRDEDRETLAPALSVPANVFDDYVPFRFWSEIEESGRYAGSLEGRVQQLTDELHTAQDEVGHLGDELARVERAAEAARRVAAEEALHRVVAEKLASDAATELAAMYGTRTFRYTSASRRLYGKLLQRRQRPSI